MKNNRLQKICAAFGVALLSNALVATGALAAPGDPTCPSSNVLTVATSTINLPCVPQGGQVLLIVVQNPLTPTAPAPSVATQAATQATTGDGMSGITDPRIDTYAKRQAIRDQYRGRINETTFNDELGDGVTLEQALHDAMAEVTLVPAKSR